MTEELDGNSVIPLRTRDHSAFTANFVFDGNSDTSFTVTVGADGVTVSANEIAPGADEVALCADGVALGANGVAVEVDGAAVDADGGAVGAEGFEVGDASVNSGKVAGKISPSVTFLVIPTDGSFAVGSKLANGCLILFLRMKGLEVGVFADAGKPTEVETGVLNSFSV